ncbi:MAG: LPS export ABC transporter periplasmic protein LptC [Treponema sp.]|nr:LPS export ABC transporter periplasmic protein LptC [Treponema sp.]
MKKKRTIFIISLFSFFFFLFLSCTFDYGDLDPEDGTMPDLVMINVDYMRVRSADPIARFQADRAERYDRQNLMKLEVLLFEQYGEKGEEVNVLGKAGSASINIRSGDFSMSDDVWLEINSEDIILETFQLDWREEPHILFTADETIVNVYQSNGTSFTGIGLTVEARSRLWEFSGNVSGTFVQNDDEDADNETDVNEAE